MWNFSQISHTFSVHSLNRCGEWELKATGFFFFLFLKLQSLVLNT